MLTVLDITKGGGSGAGNQKSIEMKKISSKLIKSKCTSLRARPKSGKIWKNKKKKNNNLSYIR